MKKNDRKDADNNSSTNQSTSCQVPFSDQAARQQELTYRLPRCQLSREACRSQQRSRIPRFLRSTLTFSAALLALASCVLVDSASAACDAAADPCAPQKKLDAWSPSLAFGYNLTSGNSETSLLSILAAAKKETSDDIIDLGGQYFLGTDKNNNTSGDDSNYHGDTVRNDIRAQGSYKYLLDGRWFIGATSNFLYDQIADIDYRVGITPNLGYFLLKDADTSLFLEAGPGYLFEKVGGVSDDYFAPRIADGFEWIISCTSKLYQKADIVLDVNDSSNYIVTAEVGVEAALNSNLALVLAAREIYDNEPAAGRERGDFILTTALKVSL